jgi:hypothetical protein
MTTQSKSSRDIAPYTPEEVVQCYADIQRELQSGQAIPNPRNILGWDIEYIEPESLLAFLDYCLFRRLNDVIAERENPVILDCGATVVGWFLDPNSVHRIDLHPPFQHLDRNCWTISIPAFSFCADSNENPSISTLVLLENERLLRPEHAVHDDICNTGGGRYSHWISCLYFSTSDNSDPNTNGRRYMAIVPK